MDCPSIEESQLATGIATAHLAVRTGAIRSRPGQNNPVASILTSSALSASAYLGGGCVTTTMSVEMMILRKALTRSTRSATISVIKSNSNMSTTAGW